MTRKPLMIAAFVLASVLASNAAQAAAPKAPEQQPCKAATAPVRYGNLLKVPQKLRAEIDGYRKAWAAACKKGGGSSMHALLERAERIRVDFAKLLANTRLTGPRVDQLHTELQRVYPTFVPAFVGSLIEYEFFLPMLDVYVAHARLGNDEDRRFLASYQTLFGGDFKANPWIERTWDHGGCIKLGWDGPGGKGQGGFDFVATADRLARLKGQIKGRWYLAQLNGLEKRMRYQLNNLTRKQAQDKRPLIDACGTKAAAVAALDRTAAGLEKRAGWTQEAASVRRTISGIAAGKVRLCEKGSCAGG